MASDAKALVNNKLARVQDALAIAEKARRKAKAEAARLEVEQTSLLLEIKTTIEEALELMFAYDYGCCVFKHNTYGDQPKILDRMPDSSDLLPPKFFMYPRCPPVREPTEPKL